MGDVAGDPQRGPQHRRGCASAKWSVRGVARRPGFECPRARWRPGIWPPAVSSASRCRVDHGYDRRDCHQDHSGGAVTPVWIESDAPTVASFGAAGAICHTAVSNWHPSARACGLGGRVWRADGPKPEASTGTEEAAHGVHAPAEDVLAKRPNWQTPRRLWELGRHGPARGPRHMAEASALIRAGGQCGIDLAVLTFVLLLELRDAHVSGALLRLRRGRTVVLGSHTSCIDTRALNLQGSCLDAAGGSDPGPLVAVDAAAE